MRISQRAQRVEPFYVMELAKAAADMAAGARPGDRPMITLNIGEPDFTAPPLVQLAAERAIHDGRSQYTAATGLPALRRVISGWYAARFGLDIDPGRIVITAGASAALQLACLALIEAGDEVLMPDPSYPCNRQFVQAAEGKAVLLPSGPAERFQLSAEQVQAAVQRNADAQLSPLLRDVQECVRSLCFMFNALLDLSRNSVFDAVTRSFPDGTRIVRPAGGYFVWVELPIGVDAMALHQAALAQQISLAPGPIFSATRGFGHCARLNYGHPWDAASEAAMAVLGRLLAAF